MTLPVEGQQPARQAHLALQWAAITLGPCRCKRRRRSVPTAHSRFGWRGVGKNPIHRQALSRWIGCCCRPCPLRTWPTPRRGWTGIPVGGSVWTFISASKRVVALNSVNWMTASISSADLALRCPLRCACYSYGKPSGKRPKCLPLRWSSRCWCKSWPGASASTGNALLPEQFWQQVARLGGHQGRRHDGPPGWRTVWRGWRYLSDLADGARLFVVPDANLQ